MSDPGDRAAGLQRARTFESCYREHYDRVFRLSLRLGNGDVGYAEDVTHDVLLTLMRRLPDLEDQEDLGAWLYRVTMNAGLRRLRRERSLLERVRLAFWGRDDEHAAGPDVLFEQHETAARVRESLGRLPPRERVVICMKMLDGKSQQEIAETLALTKGYVSKLVNRAYALLRRMGWQVDDAGT